MYAASGAGGLNTRDTNESSSGSTARASHDTVAAKRSKVGSRASLLAGADSADGATAWPS